MDQRSCNQIAEFMFEMRRTGHYAGQLIGNKGFVNIYEKQFVIACLVSGTEIQTGDFTALAEFRHYLDNLQRINVTEGYLQYGRVTFLMNKKHNCYNKHGEARLLDKNGLIRAKLGIYRGPEFKERKDYLAKMHAGFRQVHGYGTKPYLLIFSYYIPCTIEGHMCAEVIGEFAAGSSYKVFVGYENIHERTNWANAILAMTVKGVEVIYLSQLFHPQTKYQLWSNSVVNYFEMWPRQVSMYATPYVFGQLHPRFPYNILRRK